LSEELETVNHELRMSLLKFQPLSGRRRHALDGREILDDRRMQEHLGRLIRRKEKKTREMECIGLPPASVGQA
jgi:hypothetical protein